MEGGLNRGLEILQLLRMRRIMRIVELQLPVLRAGAGRRMQAHC